MKTKLLKQIHLARYVFAFVLIVLMILIAQISGEKEIIFPEIAALALGGLIAQKQPWSTNKRRIFILMSLSSLFGILVVKFLPLPLVFQVVVCFIFSAFILTLFKTTLVPVISACILPVYLGVDTYVYPISVSILSLIIITAQWQMEKHSMRPKNHFMPCDFSLNDEFKKWAKLLLILVIVSLIPYESRYLFLVAPPLIVTFVEFSNPKNPIRKKWFKVWLILCYAAFLGTFASYILNLKWHLPLIFCVSIALVLLFYTLERVNTLFAPAGAILLLPLLLAPKDLVLYPFEVLIGSFVLIWAARFSFRADT